MTSPKTTTPLNLIDAPDVLTVEEAAKLLRLGINSCYEAVRTKQVPSVKIGKRILIPKTAIQKMLNLEQKEEQIDDTYR